jgi:hypothetical protein
MFFGSLDWQVGQIEFTWGSENFEMLEKNEP